MSVLVNFTIFPTDKGVSASPYVARVIEMFQNSGVSYALNSMSTNFETESMEEALEIINRSYQLLAKDSDRIYIVMTMDIQKGRTNRISKKVESVKSKLNHGKN